MLDSLTRIPSFDAFLEALKNSKHPKLFLIDIKEFKKLNLVYSDEAGDFVLKEFALSLSSFARINDMGVFRLKDDEFAFIKDMPFDLEIIEKILFSITDLLTKQKYIFGERRLNIESHMGICVDQNNMLEKARKALKIAKIENQPFVTYSDFVNRLIEEDEEYICEMINNSLINDGITPYFQNIVDLDGNTIYQEALIRIINKEEIIPPSLFLNIAKKHGLYHEIVKHLAEKIDHKKAINVSTRELNDSKLFELYRDTKAVLEMQNDEFLQELDLPIEGIRVCLDNISSAKSIKNGAQFVKVKGDLIRLLGADDEAKTICKDIISTCREKNIKTIASHINSNSSFEEAKKLGFNYYQGFFFGEPTSTSAE